MTHKLLLSCFISTVLSGCYFSDDYDYYAEIEEVCTYITPHGVDAIDDELIPSKTPLTDACRERLEEVIGDKIKDPSLISPENPNLRLKILETLQFIASAPLKRSEQGALLGFGDDLIPFDFHCRATSGRISGCPMRHQYCSHLSLRDPKLLNCSLFNFLLNQVDSFRFRSGDGSYSGYYTFENFKRTVILSLDFWDSFAAEAVLTVSERASLLLHESYHGTGEGHPRCSTHQQNIIVSEAALLSWDPTTYPYCDYDLTSPHGFEAFYFQLLIDGVWDAILSGEHSELQPAVNFSEMRWIFFGSCIRLKWRLERLPPGLAEWLHQFPTCLTTSDMLSTFSGRRDWSLFPDISEFHDRDEAIELKSGTGSHDHCGNHE